MHNVPIRYIKYATCFQFSKSKKSEIPNSSPKIDLSLSTVPCPVASSFNPVCCLERKEEEGRDEWGGGCWEVIGEGGGERGREGRGEGRMG